MSLQTYSAEEFPDEVQVCSEAEATRYATEVATEAIKAFKANQPINPTTGTKMNQEMQTAVNAVVAESKISAQLVTGEILLDNIETVATNLVMSRLSFWQKLAISKTQKEFAITVAVYTIVHAIKTGGFGLTGYKVNHAALDMITIAANKRMLSVVVDSLGVDTNVAGMLFKAPTVEAE